MVTQPRVHGALEWADRRWLIDLRVGEGLDLARAKASDSMDHIRTPRYRRIYDPTPSSAPHLIKSDTGFLSKSLLILKLILETRRHCGRSALHRKEVIGDGHQDCEHARALQGLG